MVSGSSMQGMDFTTLMSLLYQGDIYADFDPAEHPDDMQGWNSTDPNFVPMLTQYRPQLLVEVGSWKGASAVHMARVAQGLGFTPTILCIDTWQGGVEHRNFDATGYDSLRVKNGYPQLYYTFLANIVRQGLQHQVVPFANTSLNAAHWMHRNKVVADLVFLDGSHAFDDVLMEMTQYFDLVKPGGAMFGDDYNWDSVRAAVLAFAKINGITVEERGIQWVIRKLDAKPTEKMPTLISNAIIPQSVTASDALRLIDGQLEQLIGQVTNARNVVKLLLKGK